METDREGDWNREKRCVCLVSAETLQPYAWIFLFFSLCCCARDGLSTQNANGNSLSYIDTKEILVHLLSDGSRVKRL